MTVGSHRVASGDEADRYWMGLAIELAKKGRGFVEPNPMVGCIAVANGHAIAQGFHQRYGGHHAEVEALAGLGPADLREATVYVTLEPCSHFGKTPPCAPFVLERRPKRVVVAMPDPFPAVSGRGIALLREAGIEVDVGVHRSEAEQLNAPYLKLLHFKRPWVTAKWAMSLDGAIATKSGDSKWISSDRSRERVHQTRAKMDAMITGIGTVLADNPMLTARPKQYNGPVRNPIRVVLDRNLRIPLECQLVASANEHPTIVVTLQRSSSRKIETLRSTGVDVLVLEEGETRSTLEFALDHLGTHRCTHAMLECGPALMGHAMDRNCVDEIECFVAPIVLGGNSIRPVGGSGIEKLCDAQHWVLSSSTPFGDDILLTYRLANS
ncbi:bifunctional diaminohydroxyphosphoribosylaminopyrimidine deaminase/5-amino-6-(5-phosphoribosylamino)uracil reductase RibD [Pirellula sp. SH-Sr6A]|uniref:bifunctional diaminohydroxyphosphoribosylaminopyrimidine deaminase/5-amino-6-(5-phosphoribosylamino)uracil reductase RibD n=1 Tax=Pirellula sp. SH-Sr6A TaxID=1632865 RepID=UPI0014387F74|nr:bifunctional diaminohydroxyphosphoribosylaminopyrimidine deaminase/5-amino-6-(5-phosphoribosylamino)uracil reductase RibD [Pirellula sp. SH-Sr6A]